MSGCCSSFVPDANGESAGGGGGGSGTVGPGTPNTVAKFTAPTVVGDSSITDDGATVTVNADALVTGSLGVTGVALLDSDADIAGDAFVGGLLVAEGPIVKDAPLSPAALAAGTTNDYAPVGIALANRLRVTTDAAGSSLGGIDTTNFVDGQELDIISLGPGPLTLIHDEAGSTAAFRFQLEGGVDRVIGVNGIVTAQFDAVSGCLYVKG